LNLLAGGRISANTRSAIHQNQFAQSRQRESILSLFVRQVTDAFEDLDSLFFCERIFFSDCSGDL